LVVPSPSISRVRYYSAPSISLPPPGLGCAKEVFFRRAPEYFLSPNRQTSAEHSVFTPHKNAPLSPTLFSNLPHLPTKDDSKNATVSFPPTFDSPPLTYSLSISRSSTEATVFGPHPSSGRCATVVGQSGESTFWRGPCCLPPDFSMEALTSRAPGQRAGPRTVYIYPQHAYAEFPAYKFKVSSNSQTPCTSSHTFF